MKLFFSMMWFMKILKIYIEEQLLIKYYGDKVFNIAKNSNYDGYY